MDKESPWNFPPPKTHELVLVGAAKKKKKVKLKLPLAWRRQAVLSREMIT